MATSIGFTADVMLGRGVERRYREPDQAAGDVWGDLLATMHELDGLLVNLECCLSDRGTQWTRTHRPFHLRASPDWATSALDAADICALANNHVIDYEEVALADTLDALDAGQFARSGAGMDLAEAWDPAAFDVGGLRVTVVSLTDNTLEFAADETSPGTAHVVASHDDATTRSRVRDALARARRTDPDLLVVSAHVGPNVVDSPSTGHHAFAHWLIEAGADVVHGHSAHVFQGIECHEGSLILHDTGDFVDDYAVDAGLRNDRSFLYELVVADSNPVALRLHPTCIRDRQVRTPPGDRSWLGETLQARSSAVAGVTDFEWSNGTLVCRLD